MTVDMNREVAKRQLGMQAWVLEDAGSGVVFRRESNRKTSTERATCRSLVALVR